MIFNLVAKLFVLTMTNQSIYHQLEQAGLFEKKLTLSRNEFICRAGKIDQSMYRIESGSIRIFVNDGSEEQIIRLGYSGDIVATLDSFLTGKPTDFYIQTIKKTTISIAEKTKFTEFVGENPERLKWWISTLENLVIQQIEREKDLLIASPQERLQRVLSRSPKLFQEIPAKHIANYLRMTPETLSRMKKS